MVVITLPISFPLVEVYDGRILESCGDIPLSQKDENSSCNFFVRVGPPDLQIYAGMASEPGALPQERCLMAFSSSGMVGMLSRASFVST